MKMHEVKIRKVPEPLSLYVSGGNEVLEPSRFSQLYFVESGEVAPEGLHRLKQDEKKQYCMVGANGRVKFADVNWITPDKPIYLV